MFRYQHRLQRGVTISRHLHTHRAGVTVTVSDPDPEDTPLLSHDAAALLPLGDTIAIWSADDGALTTTAKQVVSVVDTTPPMLDAVADVVVYTADPDGALVTFTTPAASDRRRVTRCRLRSDLRFSIPRRDQRQRCSRGTDGDDILLGMRGDDYLGGGPGDDLLVGGTGKDILIQ